MGEMNEKELEELLKSLPRIKDRRNPQEIYQNISLKMEKRKGRSWMIPSLAGAAALLLFIFLVPQIMDWDNFALNFTGKDNYEKEEYIESGSKQMETVSQSGKESLNSIKNGQKQEIRIDEQEIYSAVYDTGDSQYDYFVYPIPDRNGQILVPITVVARTEKNKAAFEQYTELMPLLKEEEWGLSDYYPLNGKLTLSEDQKTLHVDLPRNHIYGEGSSSEHNFMRVINDTAASRGIETITFSTEGNPGVNFSHTGYVEKMPVYIQGARGYYFYTPPGAGKKLYLVPSNQSYATIQEALGKMKENIPVDNLEASIPKNFVIAEVIEASDLLIIRLDDTATVTNETETIYTIEAILLTAKEFNFKRVKIENSNLASVGKFRFSEEWTVPLAPNRMILAKK